MKYFLAIFVFVSLHVHADIYKLALPSDSGLKFYWWPNLPEVSGWHHDRDHSIHYGANAQAPDGYTFSNAETVIYASAIFKPRVPDIENLKHFIKNDHVKFKHNANLTIKKADPMVTGDGFEFESFTFFPVDKGNWEQVAYGEEGDYYLVFTVSSRSNEGYKKSWVAYEQFIKNYKKQP